MSQQQELLRYYSDPRVRAVLGVIRDAEGTSKYGDPYRVAGGGNVTLSSLDTPTFHLWNFKDKTGKQDKSSATGAYQFLRGTWGGLQKNYGFSDFSPRTQDLAAIALLKESGALPYIQRGDYFGGLNAARKIWASLPGAGYNQQERGYDFLKKSLEKHLGSPVEMYAETTPQRIHSPAIEMGDITPQPYDPYAKLFNIEQPMTEPPGPQEGYIDPQPVLYSGRRDEEENPFLVEL